MSEESKTWEQYVSEARAAAETAQPPVDSIVALRGRFAYRLEDAHARAVRDAEELAEEAARLAAALKKDGIGATFAGSNFHNRAHKLRDGLVALEAARETFSAAVRVKWGGRGPRRARGVGAPLGPGHSQSPSLPRLEPGPASSSPFRAESLGTPRA